MSAPHLTPRERELLVNIASGSGEKQAARAMGLSQHTVKSYGKTLRAKFGVRNAVQLVAAAVRAGLA